tara:strand:- start:637 stop:1974 length:1338 start_codon:yes stop_codon:yes gene_type:complete
VLSPLLIYRIQFNWLNQYDPKKRYRKFDLLQFSYFFTSRILYYIYSLFTPVNQSLTVGGYEFMSNLIEGQLGGAEGTEGVITPRSLTKSIVPYQYNVNEPVSHYAWNPVLPPNLNDSSIKLTEIIASINKYNTAKNASDKREAFDNIATYKLQITSSGDILPYHLGKSNNNLVYYELPYDATASKTSNPPQIKLDKVDKNGYPLTAPGWVSLIQGWGAYYIKNGNGLYDIASPTWAGSDSTNLIIKGKEPIKIWNDSGQKGNFLQSVWGLTYDAPIIKEFITNASISGSGADNRSTLDLEILLGIAPLSEISGGWYGLLQASRIESYDETYRYLYSEDVNVPFIKNANTNASKNRCKDNAASISAGINGGMMAAFGAPMILGSAGGEGVEASGLLGLAAESAILGPLAIFLVGAAVVGIGIGMYDLNRTAKKCQPFGDEPTNDDS